MPRKTCGGSIAVMEGEGLHEQADRWVKHGAPRQSRSHAARASHQRLHTDASANPIGAPSCTHVSEGEARVGPVVADAEHHPAEGVHLLGRQVRHHLVGLEGRERKGVTVCGLARVPLLTDIMAGAGAAPRQPRRSTLKQSGSQSNGLRRPPPSTTVPTHVP